MSLVKPSVFKGCITILIPFGLDLLAESRKRARHPSQRFVILLCIRYRSALTRKLERPTDVYRRKE